MDDLKIGKIYTNGKLTREIIKIINYEIYYKTQKDKERHCWITTFQDWVTKGLKKDKKFFSIKNEYKNRIKGFIQYSRMNYKNNLKNTNYIDKITFGFCDNGKIEMEWIESRNKIVPQLIISSDAWKTLSNFHNFIDLLSLHNNEDFSPKEFCEFLLQCGFTDLSDEK